MTNFVVNGASWNDYLADDFAEIPRMMEGANGGVAINGDTIFDYTARKYDLSVSTRPLTADKLALINSACSGAALPVTFFSGLRNRIVTQYCVISISKLERMVSRNAQDVYDVASLSFTEK